MITPRFIQLMAAGTANSPYLYGLTADGKVYYWVDRKAGWVLLENPEET